MYMNLLLQSSRNYFFKARMHLMHLVFACKLLFNIAFQTQVQHFFLFFHQNVKSMSRHGVYFLQQFDEMLL
jgi:hypothetical protein